jgi:transposase-like protein
MHHASSSMGRALMPKCPNCKKEITNPEKTLKNQVFQIDAYTCNSCGHNFKVSIELPWFSEYREPKKLGQFDASKRL